MSIFFKEEIINCINLVLTNRELTFTVKRNPITVKKKKFFFFFRQNSNVVNLLRKMHEMMFMKYIFKKFRQMDERKMKSRKIMSDIDDNYQMHDDLISRKKNLLFVSFFSTLKVLYMFSRKRRLKFFRIFTSVWRKNWSKQKSSLFVVVWLTLFSRKNWFWETILWSHEKMVNFLRFYFSLLQFEFTKKTKMNLLIKNQIHFNDMMHIDYQRL